jgi:hypothetical protein
MKRYRRVEADTASESALGILVPPARQTFVILRPRALAWDLVLCRDEEDASFRALAHDEASFAAQSIDKALRNGESPEVFQLLSQVRLRLGDFVFVLCARVSGQPYVPLLAGESEAEVLRAAFVGDEEQELYFNLRHFYSPS